MLENMLVKQAWVTETTACHVQCMQAADLIKETCIMYQQNRSCLSKFQFVQMLQHAVKFSSLYECSHWCPNGYGPLG